jgi:hypothetical protein
MQAIIDNARNDRTPALPRSQRFERVHAGQAGSSLGAFFLIAISSIIFALSSDKFQHWFLIPVSVCGILMTTDALQWIRGRLDLYDPAGIIGLIGVHFFFVAPLLHVLWDFYIPDVAAPPDWRDWLGYMGILNAVGLLGYRMCRQLFAMRGAGYTNHWSINKSKFHILLPVFLMMSAAAQTWVYAHFGGLTGYIDIRLADPKAMQGMGWIFMISESAPILAAFFVILHLQRKIGWIGAAIALLALFLLQLCYGGLRGSRSETVELFFWVIGCYHFLVRPVPRRFIYCGCVFLAFFLYFYAFYKNMGKNATQAFTASAEDRQQIERETHRTPSFLLLVDLGRSDLQAYILFRLVNDRKDFDYAKGRTYIGAISEWIPRWVLPNRPDTKVREGTEIQTGSGYDPNSVSSRVYGLAGEGMLNFGPIAVPAVYAIFGLLIGWFRRAVGHLLPGDARFLLVPFGVYMLLGILFGDSDNVAFGLAKNGLLPFLVVFLSSIKLSYPHKALAYIQGSRHETEF